MRYTICIVVILALCAVFGKADVLLGITPSAIHETLPANTVITKELLFTKSVADDVRLSLKYTGDHPEAIEFENSYILPAGKNNLTIPIQIHTSSPETISGKLLIKTMTKEDSDVSTELAFNIEVDIHVLKEGIRKYEIKRVIAHATRYGENITIELDVDNTGILPAEIDDLSVQLFDTEYNDILLEEKVVIEYPLLARTKKNISLKNDLLPGQYFAIISDQETGFNKTIPIEVFHDDSKKFPIWLILGAGLALIIVSSKKRLFIIVVLALIPNIHDTIAYDPVIENVSIESIVYPAAGTFINAYCNGTITDADGAGNISWINAVIYDSVSCNSSDTDDNNYHYTNNSCSSASSGNTTNVTCSFQLWYYAYAGRDWYCNITASDGQVESSASEQFEVEELQALTVTDLEFHNGTGGALALGSTSDQASMNITNIGNTNISVSVSGTDMGCDYGTIPVENQRYSITDGFLYKDGISLTDRSEIVPGFDIPVRTGLPIVNYLYWLFKIPDMGVGGNCTGTITANAK